MLGGKVFSISSSGASIVEDAALKVLYNYYSSGEGNAVDDAISPDQWHLLHQQRNREVNMRPPCQHPNIVPILGAVFSRAPPPRETDGTIWERIEEYSFGFAGRPLTWLFLMPRFVHFSNACFQSADFWQCFSFMCSFVYLFSLLCEDSKALLKIF